MAKVLNTPEGIRQARQSASRRINSLVRTNQWGALADEFNRICNTIVFQDEIIGSDLVQAVLQEATDEYGTDELVSGGNLHMQDYATQEIKEKIIELCDGTREKVEYMECRTPYDSQLLTLYKDYLSPLKKKVLPLTVPNDKLTSMACGLDTFNKYRDLFNSKGSLAVSTEIRNLIFCMLNDSRNYAKILDVAYTCNDCDGDNIISALVKLSNDIQINAKNYNKAGRSYEAPRKTKLWLIMSPDFAARVAGIMSSKFNTSFINLEDKFARVFEEPKLTIADFVIIDREAIQFKQVKNTVTWKFDDYFLNECGNYHYWYKEKMVNFLVAMGGRMVKVNSDDKELASKLDMEIRDLEDIITADTQEEAETEIKKQIDALNDKGQYKLNLEYIFDKFEAPTDKTNGYILVSVEMTDGKGTILNTTNRPFHLKKK